MSIFSYWQALRRLAPMELALALFGLSGLLLLVAAADLEVARRALDGGHRDEAIRRAGGRRDSEHPDVVHGHDPSSGIRERQPR